MSNTILSCAVLTVFLLIFGAGYSIGRVNGKETGYKEGQIDVLSHNKIRYELIVHPDSTRSWEEKK